MNKARVAIIGIEHIHANNLFHEFDRYGDRLEWLGCADIPPVDGDFEEAAQTRMERNLFGCNIKLYDDYHELLDMKTDLVIVCSSIKNYPRVVEETLGLNLNTLIEKPMAMTFEDGKRMYDAYKKSGAMFAVNWPVAWFPAFHKVRELIDSGCVGEVLRVHYRNPATLGPYPVGKYSDEEMLRMFWYQHSMGGGSSMDYAGYGCMLATWMFGRQAEKVSGIRKNFNLKFSDVEDYTAYILDFGDGAAVIEGSWSTFNNGEIPTGPVIYGTKGVIVSDRYTSTVKVYNQYSHQNTAPDSVYETVPWNEVRDSVAKNVLDYIQYGTPISELITPEFNIKALAALDAGIRSSYSGITEKTKNVEE